jgi:competence protein ComEA
MSLRRSSLFALCMPALLLATDCTRPSQNPEEIREKTAQTTANIKADATAVAKGVKEGLTRGNKVDINSATKGQLMALPGINEPKADRIIANRPYTAPEDLAKKKVLTAHEYDRISGQVGAK